MQLKEFINYHVETVSADDNLQRAAELMRDLDVGSLPVCVGSRLLGMVTDRDITVRATARGDDPMVTRVSDIMTPDVIACRESDSVEVAARLMQEHQIRRLFVLNDNDELVGVTSLGELAIAGDDQTLAGETLQRVSQSAEGQQQEEADLSEISIDEDESAEDMPGATRVSGLFDDSEQAKEAVEELKDAGFADELIAVALKDSDAQEHFLSETQVQTAAVHELANLPEIEEGQVLVVVDAAERATLALEIINRNHGTTGGVRLPA